MDPRVIVICEECGRKYRVNPDRIIGRAAGFSCRSCGHGIRVVKPDASLPASSRPQRADETPSASPGRPAFRRTGIGLRAKAWLVWLAAPGLTLAAVAWMLTEDPGGGPGGEAARLHLLLAAGGLLAVLSAGLAFGLRLIGRIGHLAAAAEHLASGGGGPTPAPDSGDDLDRLAAALRDAAERLHPRRGEPPS